MSAWARRVWASSTSLHFLGLALQSCELQLVVEAFTPVGERVDGVLDVVRKSCVVPLYSPCSLISVSLAAWLIQVRASFRCVAAAPALLLPLVDALVGMFVRSWVYSRLC